MGNGPPSPLPPPPPSVLVVDKTTPLPSIEAIALAWVVADRKPFIVACPDPWDPFSGIVKEHGLIHIRFKSDGRFIDVLYPAGDHDGVRSFLDHYWSWKAWSMVRLNNDCYRQIYTCFTNLDSEFWHQYIISQPPGTWFTFNTMTNDGEGRGLINDLLAKHRLATLIKDGTAMFVQLPPSVSDDNEK